MAREDEPEAKALAKLLDALPVQKEYQYEAPGGPGRIQIYIGTKG